MSPRSKSAHNMPLQQRFETFFEKGAEDECWSWLGHADVKGYGKFRIGASCERSHRAAFLIYKGEIPAGKHILHSCDRPACVNPKHLSVGSNLENQQEAWARKRKNKTQKLSAEEVLEIRESNLPQAVLSEQFGVCKPQICRLRNGTRGGGILRQLGGQMGGLSSQ